jgi:broad specificity phosphatase PhoE
VRSVLVRYDTRLTPKGEKQARSLSSRVRALSPAPEVLLASPLTRALSTSELAFEGVDIPRVRHESCPYLGWITEEALHREMQRKLLHAARSVRT